jgi:hypothetical protein
VNLYTSVNNVLKRLDDYPTISGEQVWTRAEIELYLKDGYNAFCRQTKCLLDFFYPENVPQAGNYVARWERTYFDSGMIAVGLIGFSGGYWERDYALASATGPANSTQPWESEYLVTVFAAALHPVPEDNVTVDRATHNFHRLNPEYTRFFEQTSRDFQTTTGEPWRFTMDRDGIGGFRTIPAGSGNATQNTIADPYLSLRAYWALDEASGDRVDSVGDADLTAVNTPGTVAGKIGDAATFTAASSQALYRAGQVDIDGQYGISIAFWVYAPTGSPTFARYFFDGAFFTSYLTIDTQNSAPLVVSFVAANDAGEITTSGSVLPSHDNWHHVSAKYDPATMLTYISVNRAAWSAAPTPLAAAHPTVSEDYGAGAVWLGGYPGAYSTSYMDEVGLWNAALSDAAFDLHYALTRPDFKAGGKPFGLLRSASSTEFGTWAPVGTWGVLREIPEHFPMGAQYGIPRRLYSDTANTRVEYWRLGKDPDENGFEIPERFMRYAEFFAQAKALERDGPGQDLKLSEHFMGRFNSGVRRMVLRLGENKRAVSGKIGSPGRVPTTPSLARLPWKYGRQIRRGY